MLKFLLGAVSIMLILLSCGNQNSLDKARTPEAGIKYYYQNIVFSKEIDIPEGTIDEVEVFENWVVLHFIDGRDFLINRDKVWSINTKGEIPVFK